MKPEQTHIDQIRYAFKKMQSREDLLQLLNEAKIPDFDNASPILWLG
jgi:hypothetical protein